MADVEVTLNNSGESVTYRGYVINSCDNSKVYDGSWSPTSATGMTVNVSGSSIRIIHNNTSTSDASSTFTWTSSKVSGCSKTLKVTVLGSANYKFYRHEGVLVEISSASETYTIDNNYTYSLNIIIRGGGYYYACAESSTDNSVSASSLTVSNFSSNNSNFTSSSLAINDNDGEPSGRFYIGVKCNTNSLVNLFNGNSAFSATMTFDLSYSNASIPVTININKVITTQITLTFEINANNSLDDDEGDFWGVVTYYVNDVSKFSYNFVCGSSSGDSKSSSINMTIDSPVTIKTIISMTAEYYKSAPNIDITTYGFNSVYDSISSIQSNTTYTKTYSTTFSVSDFSATSSKTFGVLLSVNR